MRRPLFGLNHCQNIWYILLPFPNAVDQTTDTLLTRASPRFEDAYGATVLFGTGTRVLLPCTYFSEFSVALSRLLLFYNVMETDVFCASSVPFVGPG